MLRNCSASVLQVLFCSVEKHPLQLVDIEVVHNWQKAGSVQDQSLQPARLTENPFDGHANALLYILPSHSCQINSFEGASSSQEYHLFQPKLLYNPPCFISTVRCSIPTSTRIPSDHPSAHPAIHL